MGKKPDNIEIYKNIAIERGGECLSDIYINCNSRLTFKCGVGHIWETKPYYVKNSKSWCPKCNKFMKDDIEIFKKIAVERGGECVSNKYVNCKSKLKFRCEKNHTWEAVPHDVKYSKSWCPICSNSIKLTIEEMQAIAKERNGECLSEEYTNAFTKLMWKCEYGHTWSAKPYLIKNLNNWCPICKGSHGERTVRKFLEKNNIEFIREMKFSDCRGNLRPLQFDFYIPQGNVLIEFDGRQHFECVNFYGCSNETALNNFNELKFNDEIKNNYCKNNNIPLIRISYKIKDVNEYLKNNLFNLGILKSL